MVTQSVVFSLCEYGDIPRPCVIQVIPFSVALHAGRGLDHGAEEGAEVPPEGIGEAGVEDGVSAAPWVWQKDHALKSSGESQDQTTLMQGPEVEGVKRQPAHTKHDHHRHHHPGDLLLQPVAFLVGCRPSESLEPQGEQERRVGHGHHGEGQSKAHDKGVREDAEPPGVRDELWHAQAFIRREVKRHGEDGEEREQPQSRRNDLCAARRSPAREAKRVGQRHVAVDAHHRQAEDAGELVDAVQHHDHFAGNVAKHPAVLEVLARYEWQTNHEETIGQGQVENIHRRGRWHFVQFQNGDDDKGIPS